MSYSIRDSIMKKKTYIRNRKSRPLLKSLAPLATSDNGPKCAGECLEKRTELFADVTDIYFRCRVPDWCDSEPRRRRRR